MMRQLRHKAITGGFWGSRGLFLKKIEMSEHACMLMGITPERGEN